MCIGLPMQVCARRPGFATVQGRGEQREVSTALVGEPAVGDWLLVFLDGAREAISPERAAEVDATLDLLQAALVGDLIGDPAGDAAFTLPSATSAEQLRAWSGQA